MLTSSTLQSVGGLDKTDPSKAHLVTKMVETANALLRITDVGELGESKARVCQQGTRMRRKQEIKTNVPFASAGGCVNDGLALLDLAEARGVTVQQIVVRGGMQATDVDIAVAMDAVLEALLQALDVAGRGEDRRHSLRDGRILLQERE